MKFSQKILILLLCITLLSVSACSSDQKNGGDSTVSSQIETTKGNSLLDPNQPVTLNLWHYYVSKNQIAFDKLVSEFNQTVGLEKGIIIVPTPKSSIAELEKEVTSSAKGVINSEDMPDIFSSYPDKISELEKMGVIADLNNYFSAEEINEYVDDFISDGIFGNKLLLIPTVKSTELLYVNDTGWREFAQSKNYSEENLKNWDDIVKIAKEFYYYTDEQTPDTPNDGKGLIGFDSVANFIIIGAKQQGIDLIDAENQKANLDETVLKKIFDTYAESMAMGYFDAVGKFRADDIKSGEIISYIGSSSSATYFPTWIEENNSKKDIDFIAVKYPTFNLNEPYAIQQGAGMAVSKSTPQKEEAAALFLKWFTANKQNIQFAMTTGYLPVKKNSFESEEFKSELEQLKSGNVSQKNVAKVYEIGLEQITNLKTYSAKPFDKSYSIRKILQDTLVDITDDMRKEVQKLREEGLSDEEILEKLDINSKFSEWIKNIKTEFDYKEIKY